MECSGALGGIYASLAVAGLPMERPSWRTSYCDVSGKLVLMSHGFGGLGLRRRACMMTLGSRQTGLTGQRPMAGHALHLEDTRGEVGARACS